MTRGAPRWSLVVVALFALLVAAPLYVPAGLYLQGFENDAVRAPSWHQAAARQLASGQGLGVLATWGWPSPPSSAAVFPPAIDVVLTAPLWWLFGWPLAWRIAQAAAVVVNAVGAGALARAAGARTAGTLVTGALFAVCPVVWRELLLGHPNTALPGFAAAALAVTLHAARGSRAAIGAAAVTGAVAAGLYPPYLVLLAPAGALLLARPVHEGGRAAVVRAALAVGGGVLLAAPLLYAMGSVRTEKGFDGFGGACPTDNVAVLGVDLARLGPPTWVGEVAPWLPAAAWLGLPAALLWSGRRRVAAALAALAVVLAVVSLGPCPGWTDVGSHFAPLAWVGWLASVVNALGRLLVPASLVLALLVGLGLDLAWSSPTTGAARIGLRVVAGGVAAVALGGSLVAWSADVHDPRHFKPVVEAPQARLLQGRAPGPIADLPYDQAGQFVVALQVPDRPRVNPPTPFTPRFRADPFVSWLHDLGDGRLPGNPPTRAQAAASGVRWVLHDRARCDHVTMRRPEPCAQQIRDALSRVLGPPVATDGSVVLWAVPEGG